MRNIRTNIGRRASVERGCIMGRQHVVAVLCGMTLANAHGSDTHRDSIRIRLDCKIEKCRGRVEPVKLQVRVWAKRMGSIIDLRDPCGAFASLAFLIVTKGI
jgi:hypothetical protein